MTYSKAVLDNGTHISDAKQLVTGCLHCAEQCNQLLKLISQDVFVDVSQGTSSVGAHVRHILDRFHCFFAGLQDGCIDYDARKRDKSIENSLDAATFALASVTRRVKKLDLTLISGRPITVRESVHHQGPVVSIPSTVDRELMGLVTHSIHHLAIIALIVKSFGYQMDDDFGKAPSTIVYERR